MKIAVLVIILLVLFVSFGFPQDVRQLLSQAGQFYTHNKAQGGGLIGGFSLAGLIGGFLFSAIGFAAFIYGKKNAEFRPMIIGIILAVYPYFTRNTIILYLIGIGLTTALFVFRE